MALCPDNCPNQNHTPTFAICQTCATLAEAITNPRKVCLDRRQKQQTLSLNGP